MRTDVGYGMNVMSAQPGVEAQTIRSAGSLGVHDLGLRLLLVDNNREASPGEMHRRQAARRARADDQHCRRGHMSCRQFAVGLNFN